MLLFVLLTVLLIGSGSSKTFENVNFQLYSLYTLKYTGSVSSSNNLVEHLPPNVIFDAIEISNSSIPILHTRSIADIARIDEISLINDGISEIEPDAFYNLPLLRKLTIRNNKIEEITEGVFNYLPVAVLELDDNGIKHIDSGAFDNMTELLRITLNGNKIHIWDPDWFVNTPNLRTLNFQRNQIKILPENAFKNFRSNPNLNIVLSNNAIENIHENAFSELEKIQNLWLDYNSITEWPENLLSEIEIKEMRMEYNKIKCFTGDLSKIFKANTTYISGNPLDCGCLEKIKSWTINNNRNVELNYAWMTCLAERIDKKIKDLQDSLTRMKNDRPNTIPTAEVMTHNPDAETIETLA